MDKYRLKLKKFNPAFSPKLLVRPVIDIRRIPQGPKYHENVWSIHMGCRFGDTWLTVNFLCRLFEETGKIMRLSRYYNKGLFADEDDVGGGQGQQRDLDRKQRLTEIIGVLDAPTHGIEIVDIPGQVMVGNVHSTKYYPTKNKWVKGHYKRICYQFDGQSSAYRKNLSHDEELTVLSKLYGFELLRMGGHLSVQENVNIAASCDLFIGVCSGMSHICHSVGTPVFLISKGNHTLRRWHKNKQYVLCNVGNVIETVRNYLRTGTLTSA